MLLLAEYWSNSQYCLQLQAPERPVFARSDDDKCELIVSLMQKNSRCNKSLYRGQSTEVAMTFDVYEVWHLTSFLQCTSLQYFTLSQHIRIFQFSYLLSSLSQLIKCCLHRWMIFWQLHGCIVWNAHNTVFGSAICATVKQLYNVFFKLNDLHIFTSVPATCKKVPVRHTSTYHQKKSTGIVGNTVANVIAALLMSGEGKGRPFNIITGNWSVFSYFVEWPISFTPSNDIVRPRPLRPSSLWTYDMACHEVVFDDAKKTFSVKFLVLSVQARGMTVNWFQVGKMETRHPIWGSFGNEFPSIYNHCRVMAAWSRKTLKKISNFSVFLENDLLRGNFQNSVLKGFIATPIDLLCSYFVTFGRWESVKSCVICHTKKNNFAWLSSSRYWMDCAHNLPGPASENVLRVLQVSSKSVHFWWSYIWRREYHQSVLQSESNICLKPSFEPNN